MVLTDLKFRNLLIFLLDTDNGITYEAWNLIQEIIEESSGCPSVFNDIIENVKCQDDYYYLPTDFQKK